MAEKDIMSIVDYDTDRCIMKARMITEEGGWDVEKTLHSHFGMSRIKLRRNPDRKPKGHELKVFLKELDKEIDEHEIRERKDLEQYLMPDEKLREFKQAIRESYGSLFGQVMAGSIQDDGSVLYRNVKISREIQ